MCFFRELTETYYIVTHKVVDNVSIPIHYRQKNPQWSETTGELRGQGTKGQIASSGAGGVKVDFMEDDKGRLRSGL